MELTNELIRLLKEKHGKDLDLQNEVYYLFLKGGLFTIYLDEDTKTLKVEVEFLPEDGTHVYFSEESLENLMN